MEKRIRKWIGDRAVYDSYGQIIFREKGALGMGEQSQFLDIRGWGNISNMFSTMKDAEAFQDAVGEWVVDAVNQKLSSHQSVPTISEEGITEHAKEIADGIYEIHLMGEAYSKEFLGDAYKKDGLREMAIELGYIEGFLVAKRLPS